MEYMSVILAAGEGTRMKSKYAKALQDAAGRTLLEWVLRASDGVDVKKKIVVCGSSLNEIKERYGQSEGIVCVEQKERLGSGHAVMSAKEQLLGFEGYTLIIAGDMPLLRSETISALASAAVDENCACMMLTAKLSEPYGYGRIVRDEHTNDVLAIVEERDTNREQKKIKEVNASCYCVDNSALLSCLERLSPKNAQGEYYITDIVELIRQDGGRIGAYTAPDYRECMGVNDRRQLAQVSKILRDRIIQRHMDEGVTFIDPRSTYIDDETVIGRDSIIYPGVTIENGCEIGEDVVLYPGSRISASKIGGGTVVQNSVITETEIGANTTVGPYAFLRPDSKIGERCRIGDFVEVKNSTIGDGTKVSHLTYVGDADLGQEINIGCGVVFVNYDGKKKHRSVIEDNVFIGCNTNLVSPVNVGKGSYIAAGATLTEDVPENSLAIARARQVNKTGWKDKREG